MARSGKMRRLTAGLLVALGFSGQGTVFAQDTFLPPLLREAPQGKQRPADKAVQTDRKAEASKPAPLELILTPDGTNLSNSYLPPPPDDGLGKAVIPPANPPATAAPASNPCCSPAPAAGGAGDRFAKLPPISPLPRPGYFPIFPTGPGFYTLADALEDDERPNPPKYPYPRFSIIPNAFFDIDWRYLDDPNNTETDFWDFLKRQRFGPDDAFLFTGGGELRMRYNFEANSRLLNTGPVRNRGRDNNYDLYRARVYGDLMMTERLRVFMEFISATSPNYLLTPLPIDRDAADFLNLFVDANLFSIADNPLWFRVGRQELIYGSQRLLSALDWANTRRTFQGGKLFWHSQKDDLDLFLVQPVIPNDGRLDSVDNNQVFAGLWYTHRPKAGEFIDAYYLMLDNTNPTTDGRFGQKGGFTVHTFGTRWLGDRDNWVWDIEGMMQCGESVNQGLFAKALTVAGGYHFKDCWATPIVWLSYDYASGTPDPGNGRLNQTFNQLFPFGHYYFGFVDVVGRRNINDVASYVTFWPAKWMFTQLQCHNFWLDSPKDALYNAAGNAIRQDRTGQSGNYVGTELDFLVNFHLTNHSDLFISYSYLFAGDFIHRTATTPAGRQDPQALYVQYSYRW
jgi:hypothetical protein